MASSALMCGYCGLLMLQTDDVRKHYESTTHEDVRMVLSTTCQNLSCSFCAQKFVWLKDAQNHIETLGDQHKLFGGTKECDNFVTIRVKKDKLKEIESLGIEVGTVMPRYVPGAGSDSLDEPMMKKRKSLHTESLRCNLPRELIKMYRGRHWGLIPLPPETKLRLKEKYIILEDLPPHVVIDRITTILEGCSPESMVFTFEVASAHSDESYTYDYELNQTCLKRIYHKCSTDIKKYRQKAERIGAFLVIIKEMLESDSPKVRLRSMYYAYPNVHSKSEQSDSTIDDICMLIECTRESLNIRPSPVGLIAGPIELYEDGKLLVNCTLGGRSGCNIPTEVSEIDGVRLLHKVQYILLVEKDSIFYALTEIGFHKKHNCVLITGRGQPDIATRVLLKKLVTFLDVPAFALVDGNGHGVSIFLTYRYGSKNRAQDALLISVPELILLGLFPFEVRGDLRKKMSDKDRTLLAGMLKPKHIQKDKVLYKSIVAMHTGGEVADLEMILRGGQHWLENYVEKKINGHMVYRGP